MSSTSGTRTRKITRDLRAPLYRVTPAGVKTLQGRDTWKVEGTQITESEGHRWPPPKGTAGDVGGPFTTVKHYVEGLPSGHISVKRPVAGSSDTFVYNGPYSVNTPTFTSSSWPSDISSSDGSINSKGTTAIAQCEPTNSLSDLSTFLGETYKDGLPYAPLARSLRSRIDLFRRAGEEFLNIGFGWLPFVNDLTDFSNVVVNGHTVTSQYERDSGTRVRRTFRFPTVKEYGPETVYATGVSLEYAGGSTTALDVTPKGTVYKRTETVRDSWFSGAFTYHLPGDLTGRSGMASAAAEAEKLLGSPLSPETLWNLTPWSWAADWFTNTSDYLHNLNAFAINGLVMPYGYMMEHTVSRVVYRHVGPSGIYSMPGLTASPVTFITEVKKRRRANPFGFGLSWDSLSPFQLSIAAALGLTRV